MAVASGGGHGGDGHGASAAENGYGDDQTWTLTPQLLTVPRAQMQPQVLLTKQEQGVIR